MTATVEGGWGATLPEGQIDAETTAQGPLTTTQVESLIPVGAPGTDSEPRPTTHPPGMYTTGWTTLHDGGKGSRASSLTPGTLIDGKYRLEAMLGKGGMGIVWRAEHAHLHGSIAIKFLLDRFRAKVQVIERFRQEASVMGELGHPNIVRVYDISPASADMPYITMELLHQGSLRDHLKRNGGKIPADEAVELMDGVLSALIAAHKRGIVHRDIKPDNLMLATVRSFETDMNELQLKILDFGASLLLADTSDINTGEGIMGTPYYMSPEQASGAALDQRTDLYSTAVVLYEMISGKLPHMAQEVQSLVYLIACEEPTPISTYVPNITRPYREFFARALGIDRNTRFQTAEEMREALRRLSPRLAGKNRNTAVHMAAGDTGPMPVAQPETSRHDAAPMRSFRSVLDETHISGKLVVPARPPPPVRSLMPVALGVAVGALISALVIQWLRLGGLGRAALLETGLVWGLFAGLAIVAAWRLDLRR